MNFSNVKNVILDNAYISEPEIKQNEKFNGQNYIWTIRCKIDVLKKWMPIVIGIHDDWELNLFDFYLIGDLPFIPHIDRRGKLCLFDLEGLIICPEFEGLFNQCILRAKELIEKGISGENREDFIKEFDSYFALLSNKATAYVSLPTNKKDIKIKFCEITNKPEPREKESYAEYKKRIENVSYFASTDPKDFNIWGHSCLTQKNGMYLYIEPPECIYPPNIFNDKLDEFLNKLLRFVNVNIFTKLKDECINKSKNVNTFTKLKGECLNKSNKIVLFFEIKQNQDIVNSCGFVIEHPDFSLNDKVELRSYKKITPLSVKRMDVNYLSSRTSFSSNEIANKTILLIGCGSIGGYVFHNLIKSGCRNITLVDNDMLKPENIFRHFLGAESTHAYKVVSLANYAKRALPGINVKEISEKIEDAINNHDLKIDDFDYIVSATGNHTINRWLNNYILENKILKTVFYIWNEPLDIGCHVARINIKDRCDYRDIFSADENGILTSDLSSYVKNGQTFSKTYSGCSGTFIPYGSTLSVESSILFMDLLRREMSGRVNNNIIVSKKGDNYYFNEAGFSVSDRYVKQKDKFLEVALCDLRKDNI